MPAPAAIARTAKPNPRDAIVIRTLGLPEAAA